MLPLPKGDHWPLLHPSVHCSPGLAVQLPSGSIAEPKQTFLDVPKIVLHLTHPVGPCSESMGSRKGRCVPSNTEALCVERVQVATHSVSYKAAVPVEARSTLLDHQMWDFVARISELQSTVTREALGLLLCLGGSR